MIRPIVTDPLVLSQPAEPALRRDPAARDLADTLRAHRDHCLGMAANMIGIPRAVIAFFDGGAVVVMLDPAVLRASPETYEAEEGCLSLPGTRTVRRARWVDMAWRDEKGRKRRARFTRLAAEVIQHEMDHLAGRLV